MPTATEATFGSVKIRKADHAAFCEAAKQMNADNIEIISAARVMFESASPRKRIEALRKVREAGISSSAA